MNDVQRLSDAPLGIAVFGSSDAEPGSALWDRASALGAEIAEHGIPVITGGYGGTMAAASEAARRLGGEAIGVTCRIFSARRANPFLSLEIEEEDLFARTSRLFALSRGFVVLGGGVGTLAELALLWAQARAGATRGPIVLWDETWQQLAARLAAAGRLEGPAQRATRSARSAAEAVELALASL